MIGRKEVAFTFSLHMVYINFRSKMFARYGLGHAVYTEACHKYCSQDRCLFILSISVVGFLQMFEARHRTFASFFITLITTGAAVSGRQY